MRHKIYLRRDKKSLGSSQAYKLIKKAAAAALEAEGVDVPCEVNVLLTDDSGIHEINLEFRGIDKATDVLSFPLNELQEGNFDSSICEYDPETEMVLLGDMVISLERARAQGEEYGHGEDREISYLTVHSILHLLGYDHLDEGERKKLMRSREKLVMESLGL